MNSATRNRFLPSLILVTMLPVHLLCQEDIAAAGIAPSNPDSTSINTSRLAIVGGVLVGGITAIHIYQSYGWWKDNRAPFHFREDLKYGLNVDKIGHMYGGIVLSFIFDRSLRWANFSDESALLWGAGGALLFQTYVEMEDGFSTWGFDRVDFASDVAGSLYPIGQHYIPFMRNFDIKFSYHPSDLINEPGGVGFKGQRHIMFDDYEGQTLWLSFNVRNLLPAPADSFWPAWLCLAAGYGARDVARTNPYRVYFIALDLDMRKVIPQDTPFLKLLGEALNFIHFPMPAVKLYPNVVWYGLYF